MAAFELAWVAMFCSGAGCGFRCLFFIGSFQDRYERVSFGSVWVSDFRDDVGGCFLYRRSRADFGLVESFPVV